jgi:MarR family transcriptional regulator, 2-MHQ and catechol-resistance regulon repressor
MVSMDKRISNSKLSLKLFTVLHRATTALHVHAARQVQSSHLGLSDFAVLEILLHKGDLPINVIGSKILLTNGSMTTAIDRLEKKKLVKRVPHETDRRTKLVALTAKGKTLIEDVFAEHEAVIEQVTNGLTYDEKLQCIELAKKLGKFAIDID